MLYYGDKQRDIAPAHLLARLLADLRSAGRAYSHGGSGELLEWHSGLVRATISFGELHQAMADRLYPEEDGVSAVIDGLGEAGIAMGRCVYRSWREMSADGARKRGGEEAREERARSLVELVDVAWRAVANVLEMDLPEKLTAHVPEGFAFYSLYPEMYFSSLSRLIRQSPPRSEYLVIGVRSIGTSLAGLVGGALAEEGMAVSTETVRPRGEPFARHLRITSELASRLEMAGRNAVFLVVDEGPGLTCSSILSVCGLLEEMGVPEDRIVVLSAWRGAPSIYASDDLRARWARQRVLHTSAEEAFDGWRSMLPFFDQQVRASWEGRDGWDGVDAGDGGERSTRWSVRDLSYGRWREMLYPSEETWPAIHPPTERTKLLLTPLTPTLAPSLPPRVRYLAKFAGLGEYGEERLERAQALAAAGFCPPVVGLAHGFLLQEFVEGRPLECSDLTGSLIRRMAEYYGFIYSRFRTDRKMSFGELAEMLLYNTRQALGIGAEAFVDRWRPHAGEVDRLPAVALDGHPFPHEWIETRGPAGPVYLKVDGADHFSDHTIVGQQSILWDLAGACEEWDMSSTQAGELLGAWEVETSDHGSVRYLGLYRAAYLAFRTAALHFAIHSTNEEATRDSLRQCQSRINHRLETILT